jgi:hypothetical protein
MSGYLPPTNSQYESVREALDRADPNSLADLNRILAMGDVVRSVPVHLQGVAANTAANSSPPQLSTLGAVPLPEDAKCAYILRCTVKKTGSGGAALGEFTVEPYGTTPATTQVAPAPNGDIVFLGTDLVQEADILYVPHKGDVFGQLANSKYGITSLTLSVNASGFAALPTNLSGKAILLMYANVTVGSVTGQKIILVPSTTVVATTEAALSKDGTGIWFNLATDAPTQCVVDVLCYSGTGPGVDVNAVLEGTSTST